MNFKHYSDSELEQVLKETVLEENKIKTRVLHLLAEVERRRLYSKEHPSLFEYCVKVLKYSSGAAQRRIDSMRAMRLIPELEQKIITGELNFTAISQTQSFFRQEAKTGKPYNLEMKKEVLVKLENKSTRECMQELVKIATRSTSNKKTLNASILPAPEVKRYIPSTIKHEVYMRDKGCCSYIKPGTHERCNSKYFLEYDHILPLAKNGKTTVSNLRLLCRSHNQRAAIQRFGFSKMNGYINKTYPSTKVT